jgi:predicted dehydrogenase
MVKQINRRRFLATGTAAMTGTYWADPSPARSKPTANDRLHVGVIGVAGQGEYDWANVAAAGAEIVALCDVDEERTGRARSRFPRAKYYVDFRKMLDQKGLDAVIVATPDHMHAFATIAAMRAGLHVYCEKPLTHNVFEARLVTEIAQQLKRVTQMGTQIHAGANYRRVVELIRSGVIGPVAEVHAWCDRSWGGGDRPVETPPIPQGLDYDLWLGPAPYRPYHPTYVPFYWRRWWDFGGGTLADMACHYLDLPYWALDLKYPTRVTAEGPSPYPETAALWLKVHYDFPARGQLPPVKLTWYDGGKRPSVSRDKRIPDWDAGVLFIGSRGMLVADYGRRRLLPEKEFAGIHLPSPTIPDSIGHHREWVEACKLGGTTSCHFGYAGPLTETVLLGLVAYRLGRPIDWDAVNLRAANAPDAARFLRTEYRKPWTL